MATTVQALPVELTRHLDDIRALCERYRIQTLYVFGSAVHGTFDPESSDLDFVVDPGEYGHDVASRLFGFSDALERLLGRDLDLITSRSTGDPRFHREVDATKVAIYAAA
jgi:predicted nucleotidyltransferase